MTALYPKRLIEVDLPIKTISAHARREKSIRQGHISTLHMWWARRPLAACRAVVLAALWPDPADALCPQRFCDEAAARLRALRDRRGGKRRDWSDGLQLRQGLLEFIGDFANWDLASDPEYIAIARSLVQVAHEALGGDHGTKPLVVDPFAGGGAIPLEALRVGADVSASDLNPVAVILNKVVLEYIPKFGSRLAVEFRRWAEWVRDESWKELAALYPNDHGGATPVAFLWARTIRCEGPGCGAEVPLLRSFMLAKRSGETIGLEVTGNRRKKAVGIRVVTYARAQDAERGTVKRGAATCPVCEFTTPIDRVRAQLLERHGGAADARLACVVSAKPGQARKSYRAAADADGEAVKAAQRTLRKLRGSNPHAVPDEKISTNELRRISLPLYGMRTWGEAFAPRQAVALATLANAIRKVPAAMGKGASPGLVEAVVTCLGLNLDRLADSCSSLTTWVAGGEFQGHTFARQALPMVWDFAEVNPFADSSGNWSGGTEWIGKVLDAGAIGWESTAHVSRNTATALPLPDGAASAVVTDPPYYDAVPYAHLADYFYVWLRRSLPPFHGALFGEEATPKTDEIVVDRPHRLSTSKKDVAVYERELTRAFSECARLLDARGIGTVVFASKTTASWEAVLQAALSAGWILKASWPIDTERAARISAKGQARLGSSVHLVYRVRAADETAVGDWRTVLAELPVRIHEWMPHLAAEGIVGADAIFGCLGPALEIFSRYTKVEKASGEEVKLREYLEHVWAAVAKEALGMIFEGADATGFEEDARLTAMWLWTLSAAGAGTNGEVATGLPEDEDSGEEEEDDTDGASTKTKNGGYTLEYDAARKIAQGLGAHLEDLGSLVTVKKNVAMLLPVAERAKALFGKASEEPMAPATRTGKKRQLALAFDAVIEEAEESGGWGGDGAPDLGSTVLDRVHQAMLLFAANRGAALKRFILDDGAGKDERFWRLAQALSALYPPKSDEKRWLDGVLARKKGLGF